MNLNAEGTVERIEVQKSDLLPYPVEHLAMYGPHHGHRGTYSSPTLAAFVDAIAAQICQLMPSRQSIRIFRVGKVAPCNGLALGELRCQDQERALGSWADIERGG